ncbi:MAG TPA: RagB/SusD family nutrient uptake outer membrane protein [Longimicrobiales bacterium]|nr:RagB/SusD family nutrient uptake outer membrane protein [Longimicrobiales bacterium]
MTTNTCTRLLAAAVLLLGAAGCTDLVVEPKSTVTGANVFNEPTAYKSFLAKLYAGLAVTGQRGPDGSADIQGIDEGFSQYVRLIWQMEELPTDEAVIAWNDAGVQELNTQLWSSSNQFLVAMYYRIYFQVSLANEFLRETSDAKLSQRGVGGELATQIKQYRAEARFLRALSYWHGIDLFGDIPLVTEDDPLGSTPPKQSTRAEVYAYVVSELNAIRPDLPAPGAGQYGRADQGAVLMLLAKLYMNAGVYAGQTHYAEARAALETLINSGSYRLDPSYRHLFLADNNTSPEIIFAVTQDGTRTQTWGGTTFLIHAAVGGSMNAGTYGIDGGWWGLRVRPEIVALYPGGAIGSPDKRSAFFYATDQTVAISSLTNFNDGVAAPKYQNVTSSGAPGSHLVHADTDYPMFRLGDAYLMYAEAVLRNGGGSRAQALTYVNALRQRAYGNTSGNITDAELTLDFILAERARELLWEGHRRTDLIRFGQFTTGRVWAWKGGAKDGKATEAFRNLYPLPATELLTNPNLKQNAGY